MTQTASHRQITALSLPDVIPNDIATAPPSIELVDPRKLRVDDRYQRALSERSVKLIRKIVAGWSWTAFKPPVVVAADDGEFDVIDGQHTAIAAVTHGGIEQLPVLVVDAPEQATRAKAFVQHNRDRIQVTPAQLHNAMVAAGDDDAVTINQVCERAGVRILRGPPGGGKFLPGDTLAISTIAALVNKRFAAGARVILQGCAATGAAPIPAHMIKAFDTLLHDKEYKGEIDIDRIVKTISAMGDELEREARRFSAERKIPFWRAYTSIIFMNRRKAR